MNSFEAKTIIQLYRPVGADADDRQIAEALEMARRDPELAQWLEDEQKFQQAVREKFRQIPIPSEHKEKLLAQGIRGLSGDQKMIRPQQWWRNPVNWRTAAAILVLIGLGLALTGLWNRPRVADTFSDYESRMVRSALREYRMDLVTNDLSQIREWMASRGAPADFIVPDGLSSLSLTGGGVLRWRNHPVTMVCFNRGDDQMLFLFVMNRSAVEDPPSATPELEKISKLLAASWTDGDKTYLLAGPEEADFLQKYF